MDGEWIRHLLAAVIDLTELVDDPFRHRRPDAAAAERMRDNQRLPVEDGRQTFPRRKRGVGPAHADAELLHHVLDLSETLLIADGLYQRPIRDRARHRQGEKIRWPHPRHGIEEKHVIDSARLPVE